MSSYEHLPCILQEVLLKAGRDRDSPAHVVGMVRQPEALEVANFLIDKMGHGVLTAELLQPDELVSGIIAQVCCRGRLCICDHANKGRCSCFARVDRVHGGR